MYKFFGFFLLANLKFHSNRASESGGALNIYYSGNITIFNCNFIQNEASFGGAISYEVEEGDSLNLILKNNIFKGNKAKIGGAVAVKRKIPKSLTDNNSFVDNSAFEYGKDYASSLYRLIFSPSLKQFENNGIFDVDDYERRKIFYSISVLPGKTLPFNFYFIF